MTYNFWLQFGKWRKKRFCLLAPGFGGWSARRSGRKLPRKIYANERIDVPPPLRGEGSRRKLSCIKIILVLGAWPPFSAISRWFSALYWRKIPSLSAMVATEKVQILPVPSVGRVFDTCSRITAIVLYDFMCVWVCDEVGGDAESIEKTCETTPELVLCLWRRRRSLV